MLVTVSAGRLYIERLEARLALLENSAVLIWLQNCCWSMERNHPL